MKRKYWLNSTYKNPNGEWFMFDDECTIQEQIVITKNRKYKKLHQFHVPKLSSTVLKENNWNINTTYDELIKNGCMIELGDCQLLETLRQVSGHEYSYSNLEGLEYILKKAVKSGNSRKIEEVSDKIRDIKYMPEYLTVEFDSLGDYKKLFRYEKAFDNGKTAESKAPRIVFNGHPYVRLTCGAAQARKSIVVFCDERYVAKVTNILDAGRNLEKTMAASKFNAYFGLYSSVSSKVTMPRIAVIGAHETIDRVSVVYETPEDGQNFQKDSKLVPKIKEEKFNRFDGGGIIRPEMALQWAYDLGLDYVPANFCIRYTFTKGAVACFDFVKWCSEKNDGNYIMKDIFGDEFDVREKDIIITEDMAKMINQWDSVEDYVECSNKAGIDMRITKYAPKEDRAYNTLNYQYIQTLNWNNGFPYNWEFLVRKYGYRKAREKAVKMHKAKYPGKYTNIFYDKYCNDNDLYELANRTIKHYKDIIKDETKSRLFMCGKTDVIDVLKGKDWFVKSVLLAPELIDDPYTRDMLKADIQGGIDAAKLGKGIEKANYQCLVPDSYAFCEFMAGKEVKGILAEEEYYSAFWNNQRKRNHNNPTNKELTKIALARSPQTYKSEWVMCNLNKTDEAKKWYMHQYSGLITPIYGDYTMKLAGSDFDYDIGYTTDDEIIISNAYKDLPVTCYDVPKPQKIKLTRKSLREADTHSFGQKIGQITNISTVLYCMQSNYTPADSEYWVIESRLQQLCIAQSKQIDKTKIGQAVKSIPSEWSEGDSSIAIKRGSSAKPYFMKYNYPTMNTEYSRWARKYDDLDWEEYYLGNDEYKEPYYSVIQEFEIYLDPCPMNRWSWYIEAGLNRCSIRRSREEFDYSLMTKYGIEYDEENYQSIYDILDDESEYISNSDVLKDSYIQNERDEKIVVNNLSKEMFVSVLKYELLKQVKDLDELVSCLVKYFYEDENTNSKAIFWKLVGEEVYYNLMENCKICIPVKDEGGEIDYLYGRYTIKNYSAQELREELY